MKITNQRGRPIIHDFELKEGEYRRVKFTRSKRSLVYKTAERLGYKVVTRVRGQFMEIERQPNAL